MNLRELLGLADKRPVDLNESQRLRLAACRDRAGVDRQLPHDRQRYVAIDVEATGLDLADDGLLAIGAVAIDGGLIDCGQVYAARLAGQREPAAAPAGDSLVRSAAPVEPVEALLGFLEFAAGGVLVAHRAEFPRTMLLRAMRKYLGVEPELDWIDLAYLLPALFDGPNEVSTPLGVWLSFFSIANPAPHNAVADAYAVARLMQRVTARAGAGGYASPESLAGLEEIRRRVQRGL